MRTEDTGKKGRENSLLKSLEKSLDVLDIFVECNTGLTLKEIAEKTDLNTSTAFRIVNTLERRQYLTRNEASKQSNTAWVLKRWLWAIRPIGRKMSLPWLSPTCAVSSKSLMKRPVFM